MPLLQALLHAMGLGGPERQGGHAEAAWRGFLVCVLKPLIFLVGKKHESSKGTAEAMAVVRLVTVWTQARKGSGQGGCSRGGFRDRSPLGVVCGCSV